MGQVLTPTLAPQKERCEAPEFQNGVSEAPVGRLLAAVQVQIRPPKAIESRCCALPGSDSYGWVSLDNIHNNDSMQTAAYATDSWEDRLYLALCDCRCPWQSSSRRSTPPRASATQPLQFCRPMPVCKTSSAGSSLPGQHLHPGWSVLCRSRESPSVMQTQGVPGESMLHRTLRFPMLKPCYGSPPG